MEWTRVTVRFVRSPAVALASDRAVSTWLRLLAYCADQENHGTISFEVNWSTREWMATAGVTAEGIEEATHSGLVSVEGRILRVIGYEADTEANAAASRVNGLLGGRPPRARRNQTKPTGYGSQEPLGFESTQPSGSPPSSPPFLPLNNPPLNPSLSSPPPDCAEPAFRVSPLLTFPTVPGKKNGTTEWHFTNAELVILRVGFPNLDIMAEVKAAWSWIMTNKTNRKTADGMLSFLNRWLTRAQNRPRWSQPFNGASNAVAYQKL